MTYKISHPDHKESFSAAFRAAKIAEAQYKKSSDQTSKQHAKNLGAVARILRDLTVYTHIQDEQFKKICELKGKYNFLSTLPLLVDSNAEQLQIDEVKVEPSIFSAKALNCYNHFLAKDTDNLKEMAIRNTMLKNRFFPLMPDENASPTSKYHNQ